MKTRFTRIKTAAVKAMAVGRYAATDLTNEDQRQLDALGMRRITPYQLRAARDRLARASSITPAFELGRLRARMDTLTDAGLKSGCQKAIAELSLVAEERNRQG